MRRALDEAQAAATAAAERAEAAVNAKDEASADRDVLSQRLAEALSKAAAAAELADAAAAERDSAEVERDTLTQRLEASAEECLAALARAPELESRVSELRAEAAAATAARDELTAQLSILQLRLDRAQAEAASADGETGSAAADGGLVEQLVRSCPCSPYAAVLHTLSVCQRGAGTARSQVAFVAIDALRFLILRKGRSVGPLLNPRLAHTVVFH